MTPATIVRRAIHLVMDPPDGPARIPRRTGPGCRCRAVDHALTLRAQGETRAHLTVALAAAEAGDSAARCRVAYLAQRLAPCTTRGVAVMDALFEVERPAPPERAVDYASWLEGIRPAFVAAARSGEVFVFYDVAKAYELKEPPKPECHWGLAAIQFHGEGWMEPVNFARSSRPKSGKSSLMQWRGVPARMGSAA